MTITTSTPTPPSAGSASTRPALHPQPGALPRHLLSTGDLDRAGFVTTSPTTDRLMLTVVDPERLRRVLVEVLDEDGMLSPHGIRSVSKRHLAEPFAHLTGFGIDAGHVGRLAVEAIEAGELYVPVFPDGQQQRFVAPLKARADALHEAGLKGSVRSVEIYKTQRFSDHAPLTVTYDL